MHNGSKISVVLPAFNEAEFIAEAVADARATGVVDEIIVVDNNSTDGTGELAAQAGARVVPCEAQGYGHALQAGLRAAEGDYLVLCEPDGTFHLKDIHKLLAYTDDFDVVLGTRTNPQLIWEGANMRLDNRMGNLAVAKLLEWLFNGPGLTDSGCTFRLLKRSAYEDIRDHLSVGGSHFLPEIVILSLLTRQELIEVPVNYRPRTGESTITGTYRGLFRVAFAMIRLILAYRFRVWFDGWHPAPAKHSAPPPSGGLALPSLAAIAALALLLFTASLSPAGLRAELLVPAVGVGVAMPWLQRLCYPLASPWAPALLAAALLFSSPSWVLAVGRGGGVGLLPATWLLGCAAYYQLARGGAWAVGLVLPLAGLTLLDPLHALGFGVLVAIDRVLRDRYRDGAIALVLGFGCIVAGRLLPDTGSALAMPAMVPAGATLVGQLGPILAFAPPIVLLVVVWRLLAGRSGSRVEMGLAVGTLVLWLLLLRSGGVHAHVAYLAPLACIVGHHLRARFSLGLRALLFVGVAAAAGFLLAGPAAAPLWQGLSVPLAIVAGYAVLSRRMGGAAAAVCALLFAQLTSALTVVAQRVVGV